MSNDPENTEPPGTAETQLNSSDSTHISAPQLIKDRLQDFANGVNVIGVKQAADSSTPSHRRVIWTLLVVGSLCLTAYQIQDRIAYYFEYPTDIAVNIIPADSLHFPQVTICNENRLQKEPAEALGKLHVAQ